MTADVGADGNDDDDREDGDDDTGESGSQLARQTLKRNHAKVSFLVMFLGLSLTSYMLLVFEKLKSSL